MQGTLKRQARSILSKSVPKKTRQITKYQIYEKQLSEKEAIVVEKQEEIEEESKIVNYLKQEGYEWTFKKVTVQILKDFCEVNLERMGTSSKISCLVN
ncbi:hypothetical protein M1146_03930 [Patescibacteria group bacterium]|nr:hypothetical protein [Patescibacteria group bacterium]